MLQSPLLYWVKVRADDIASFFHLSLCHHLGQTDRVTQIFIPAKSRSSVVLPSSGCQSFLFVQDFWQLSAKRHPRETPGEKQSFSFLHAVEVTHLPFGNQINLRIYFNNYSVIRTTTVITVTLWLRL